MICRSFCAYRGLTSDVPVSCKYKRKQLFIGFWMCKCFWLKHNLWNNLFKFYKTIQKNKKEQKKKQKAKRNDMVSLFSLLKGSCLEDFWKISHNSLIRSSDGVLPYYRPVANLRGIWISIFVEFELWHSLTYALQWTFKVIIVPWA